MFNTAGLRCSGIIIPDAELRQRINRRFTMNKAILQNNFSVPSYIAAYTKCDDYIEQLLPYLENNIAYVDEFLKKNAPKIKLVKSEATYLIWLDCAELGLEPEALSKFFINDARIYVNAGTMFGLGGERFIRINIGCPLSRVKKAMEQLKEAYTKAGY